MYEVLTGPGLKLVKFEKHGKPFAVKLEDFS